MIYYVALPFVRVEYAAAIRRAEALAGKETNAGAVAFSRQGRPELGEFEDAVILKSFGDVPDDFRFVT
jgi:hypothetical protein